MKVSQEIEVRTSDENRLIFRAILVDGDIMLCLKSAGHDVVVRYNDIPQMVRQSIKKQSELTKRK